MKNTFKQKFAFLLAITMLLSTLPTTALALGDIPAATGEATSADAMDVTLQTSGDEHGNTTTDQLDDEDQTDDKQDVGTTEEKSAEKKDSGALPAANADEALEIQVMSDVDTQSVTANNEMGISYSFEQALREALREANCGIDADEQLTIKDCQKLTGVLDLSDKGITEIGGYDYTAKGKTYGWNDLTEEEQEILTAHNSGAESSWWAISAIGRALLNVTELDLSDNDIICIPTIFLLGNPSIEKVTLPDTVEVIGLTPSTNGDVFTDSEGGTYAWGYNAFSHMKSLESINLGDLKNLEYIGEYSFAADTSLNLNVETDLPGSLKVIAKKAFGMNDVKQGEPHTGKITGDLAVFLEKTGYDKDDTEDPGETPDYVCLTEHCFELTDVTAQAEDIANYKYAYTSGIGHLSNDGGIYGNLVVPDWVDSIAAWTFGGWAIDSISIPNTTDVHANALNAKADGTNGNKNLTSIEIRQVAKNADEVKYEAADVPEALQEQVEVKETINSTYALKQAIANAQPGDTIVLSEGTFDVGTLTITKEVSLKGAGADKTILNGKIQYATNDAVAAQDNDTITIEGIKLVATNDAADKGIRWSINTEGKNGVLSGYNLNIKDCVIEGFQYGTTLDTKATNCSLNVTGTTFDTGCAISVKEGNQVTGYENNKQSGFVVEYFSNDYSTQGYYNDYAGFAEDQANGKYTPDIDATQNTVVFNVQQLKTAITNAADGATIVLAPGTYTLNENIEIHQKKLNIIGSGKAETIIEAYNNQQVQNDSRITLTGGAEAKFADITFTASYGADIVAPILGVSDTSNLELSQCTITDTSKGYSSGYGLISTGDATVGSKVTMKDCTVNSVIGNNAGVTYYVLGQGGVCELDIQNNVFNLGSWFMFNIQASGIVKNNQFNGVDGASGRAINATQLKGLRVEGNTFDDSLYGTRFVIGGDYTIANNTFEALGDDLAIGIYNKPDTKSEISGNRFDLDAESYGIRVTNLWGGIAGDLGNLNISDNTFAGTGVYHFRNDTWTGKVDLSTNNFGEKFVVKADVATGIVLPNAPSKDSYEFDGWYSEELGATYDAGATVTIEEDVTFTAQWDRISSGGAHHPEADDSTSSDRDDDNDDEEIEEEDVPLTEGDVADFIDVASDAWYADAVQYVYENGMMSGTSETTFSPDLTTTRGMIVTILYRMENEPAVTGTTAFTDVAADQYYANAVAWAAQNGIVSGITATTFAPNNAITREQMAAILYRYAQFKGYDVSAKADLSVYTDAAQVSTYATDAMAWANGAQLITGTSQATLTPAGNATRAQVATILMRFCENIAK